jgi:hypothetical protein
MATVPAFVAPSHPNSGILGAAILGYGNLENIIVLRIGWLKLKRLYNYFHILAI